MFFFAIENPVALTPVHYWLRSIQGGQFRLINFVSHFIRVQIFLIDFSFYISDRKTERGELCQIFHPSARVTSACTNICKTSIPTFILCFHHEVGLVEQRYFELFASAWSIFLLYKRSLPMSIHSKSCSSCSLNSTDDLELSENTKIINFDK